MPFPLLRHYPVHVFRFELTAPFFWRGNVAHNDIRFFQIRDLVKRADANLGVVRKHDRLLCILDKSLGEHRFLRIVAGDSVLCLNAVDREKGLVDEKVLHHFLSQRTNRAKMLGLHFSTDEVYLCVK